MTFNIKYRIILLLLRKFSGKIEYNEAHLINDRSWLVKDGSLEYNKISDSDDRFVFNRIRINKS